MSDEELDREWKPSKARPQSTMARSFSLALNDLFKIDNSIADLDAAVSEKYVPSIHLKDVLTPANRKRAVSSQTSELEALEARLRATEERLKKAASAGVSPEGKSSTGRSSSRQRTALGDTFTHSPTKEESPTSPLASEFRQTSRQNTSDRPQSGNVGRPASGWKQEAHPSYVAPQMPGGLPPTPGASESEGSESESDYVVVGAERKSADIGEDGDMPPPPPPPQK
jgi:hypothetical protein